MIDQRLRQLRLSRGLSLDALAAELGGMVSKQALSKYEQGKIRPLPGVLVKLAEVLGVKAAYFAAPFDAEVEFVAYRKLSGLTKKEEKQVENFVAAALEERLRLQERIGRGGEIDLPVRSLTVKRLEDADIAFGEVNTMADLTVHPHLRRIEVDTPKGIVTYSAPAAIFVGEPRHYGRVPAIGEHVEMPKAKVRKSS